MGRLRLRFQATQQSLSDPSPWGDSLRLFEPKINGAFGVGGGIRKPGGTFGEFWGPHLALPHAVRHPWCCREWGAGFFPRPPKIIGPLNSTSQNFQALHAETHTLANGPGPSL